MTGRNRPLKNTEPLPALVEKPVPEYPESARGHSIGGSVCVQCDLSDDGKVIHPVIVESDPPGVFDEAVLVALSRWHYAMPPAGSPAEPPTQWLIYFTFQVGDCPPPRVGAGGFRNCTQGNVEADFQDNVQVCVPKTSIPGR